MIGLIAILCLAAECDNLCQSDENKSTSSLVSLNEESRCLRISDDIDMLDIVDDLEYLVAVVRSCTISVVVELIAVDVEVAKKSSPSLLFILSKLREDTSLCFSPIIDLLLAVAEAPAVAFGCELPARLCGEAGLRGKPKSSSEASGRLRRLRKTSASSA